MIDDYIMIETLIEIEPSPVCPLADAASVNQFIVK